ncbi:MAG: KH domain-containing protein [Methanocellales archaeon]
MRQYVKVPSDRIGVIIGTNGEMKRLIEEKTKTKLNVDSETGSIMIEGEGEGADEIFQVLRATELIKAIGRGFSPERAFILIDNEELILDIIDLSTVASSEGELRRIKGRIIGKKGKMRDFMERATSTKISIYGDTVSIIGTPEQINIIRGAINMLLNGAPHGSVYGYLERKRREAKRFELDYYR